MTFYLQYRDGPSDTPIIEFRSPLPLPVPRTGEYVQLFEPHATKPKAAGKVERVDWAFRLRDDGTETEEGIDVATRVWLDQTFADLTATR